MKDMFKKQNKKGINSVVAAVTGVAVGVGAAVATSEALKNKKTRKKVDDFVSDVKKRATDYFEKSKEEPKAKKAVKKVQKPKK